jgi:hypothetical protein
MQINSKLEDFLNKQNLLRFRRIIIIAANHFSWDNVFNNKYQTKNSVLWWWWRSS